MSETMASDVVSGPDVVGGPGVRRLPVVAAGLILVAAGVIGLVGSSLRLGGLALPGLIGLIVLAVARPRGLGLRLLRVACVGLVLGSLVWWALALVHLVGGATGSASGAAVP